MSEDQLIQNVKNVILEWAFEEIEENPDSDITLEDRYCQNRDSILEVLKEKL